MNDFSFLPAGNFCFAGIIHDNMALCIYLRYMPAVDKMTAVRTDETIRLEHFFIFPQHFGHYYRLVAHKVYAGVITQCFQPDDLLRAEEIKPATGNEAEP